MLDLTSSIPSVVLAAGIIVSFLLAFGIGANDVANSFATSVGSKVLTIKQACCLATIFEILGALLLSYKVSDTLRRGVIDIDVYPKGEEVLLMLGFLSSLAACAIWLVFASFFRIPVSGTHTIVSAIVGFTLVLKGVIGVKWANLTYIMSFWIIAPIVSGAISVAIYVIIKSKIINTTNPKQRALKALPLFYSGIVFINVLSIAADGLRLLNFVNTPFWMILLLSAACSAVVASIVQFCTVPRVKYLFRDPVYDDTFVFNNKTYRQSELDAAADEIRRGKINPGVNPNYVPYVPSGTLSTRLSSDDSNSSLQMVDDHPEASGQIDNSGNGPSEEVTSTTERNGSNALVQLVTVEVHREPSLGKTDASLDSVDLSSQLTTEPEPLLDVVDLSYVTNLPNAHVNLTAKASANRRASSLESLDLKPAGNALVRSEKGHFYSSSTGSLHYVPNSTRGHGSSTSSTDSSVVTLLNLRASMGPKSDQDISATGRLTNSDSASMDYFPTGQLTTGHERSSASSGSPNPDYVPFTPKGSATSTPADFNDSDYALMDYVPYAPATGRSFQNNSATSVDPDYVYMSNGPINSTPRRFDDMASASMDHFPYAPATGRSGKNNSDVSVNPNHGFMINGPVTPRTGRLDDMDFAFMDYVPYAPAIAPFCKSSSDASANPDYVFMSNGPVTSTPRRFDDRNLALIDYAPTKKSSFKSSSDASVNPDYVLMTKGRLSKRSSATSLNPSYVPYMPDEPVASTSRLPLIDSTASLISVEPIPGPSGLQNSDSDYVPYSPSTLYRNKADSVNYVNCSASDRGTLTTELSCDAPINNFDEIIAAHFPEGPLDWDESPKVNFSYLGLVDLTPPGTQTPLSPEEYRKRLMARGEKKRLKAKMQAKDGPAVAKIFAYLQIMTACFGSFAHGGNDVCYTLGPLVSLWMIYMDGCTGSKAHAPAYILLLGSIFIAVGIWVWGRRVMKTLGEGLTNITPEHGFAIELGAALTVLLASKVGLPISTTHCKIGSVLFIAWASTARSGIDWKVLKKILFAWFFTVPVAAGLSAAFMAIFHSASPSPGLLMSIQSLVYNVSH